MNTVRIVALAAALLALSTSVASPAVLTNDWHLAGTIAATVYVNGELAAICLNSILGPCFDCRWAAPFWNGSGYESLCGPAGTAAAGQCITASGLNGTESWFQYRAAITAARLHPAYCGG